MDEHNTPSTDDRHGKSHEEVAADVPDQPFHLAFVVALPRPPPANK